MACYEDEKDESETTQTFPAQTFPTRTTLKQTIATQKFATHSHESVTTETSHSMEDKTEKSFEGKVCQNISSFTFLYQTQNISQLYFNPLN